MKTLDRLTVALAGMMCLALVSCSKESLNAYSDYVWCGEYPVQTINGTAGEMEDHTGTVMLQFLHSGNEYLKFEFTGFLYHPFYDGEDMGKTIVYVTNVVQGTAHLVLVFGNAYYRSHQPPTHISIFPKWMRSG